MSQINKTGFFRRLWGFGSDILEVIGVGGVSNFETKVEGIQVSGFVDLGNVVIDKEILR